MKIFKHFNQDSKPCFICKTTDDKETTLVAISGTEEDGIAIAAQAHVDCLPNFTYDLDRNVIIAIMNISDIANN